MTDAELDKLEALAGRVPAQTVQDERGHGGAWLTFGQIRSLVAEVRRLRGELHAEQGNHFKDKAVIALWLDEAARALRRECPGHVAERYHADDDYHFTCGDECLKSSFLATVDDAEARLERGTERLRLAERVAEAVDAVRTNLARWHEHSRSCITCRQVPLPPGVLVLSCEAAQQFNRDHVSGMESEDAALEAWRNAR